MGQGIHQSGKTPFVALKGAPGKRGARRRGIPGSKWDAPRGIRENSPAIHGWVRWNEAT
jgi:hypothetical protein